MRQSASFLGVAGGHSLSYLCPPATQNRRFRLPGLPGVLFCCPLRPSLLFPFWPLLWLYYNTGFSLAPFCGPPFVTFLPTALGDSFCPETVTFYLLTGIKKTGFPRPSCFAWLTSFPNARSNYLAGRALALCSTCPL